MRLIWVRTKAEYFCERGWTQHLADLPFGHRIRYSRNKLATDDATMGVNGWRAASTGLMRGIIAKRPT
jgi:hypothetical protein